MFHSPSCRILSLQTVGLNATQMNPNGQKHASKTKTMNHSPPRINPEPVIHISFKTFSVTMSLTLRGTVVASAAAASFRSHGVAAARAIQLITLGEISCCSQRIDSTQSSAIKRLGWSWVFCPFRASNTR